METYTLTDKDISAFEKILKKNVDEIETKYEKRLKEENVSLPLIHNVVYLPAADGTILPGADKTAPKWVQELLIETWHKSAKDYFEPEQPLANG